ncbi:MAG: DUF456 domain-containing protein [Spirochaetia bacterium]
MGLEIVLIVLGSLALLVGLVGCVLPVLPGPIIGWVAILAVFIAGGSELLPLWLLVLTAALAVGGALMDQVLPAAASRRAGAGRAGVIGSVIGMIAGMVFFPPFGLIIGAFAGALLGEILFHRDNTHPVKSALGVLQGTLLATLVKLTVTGVFAVIFVQRAVALFGT